MNVKRTVPTLLVLTSLIGLLITGCCWEPYRRHGHRRDRRHDRRRSSLELKVVVPSAPRAEVTAS
jgi:hypothetical protein